MSFVLGVLVGLIVGATFGVLLASLVWCGSD